MLALIGAGVVGAWALSPPIMCHLGDHREEFVLVTMKGMRKAVEEYGRCPSMQEGLSVLVVSGFLEKLPIDPWWGSYDYQTDGQTYSLTSFGADGRASGDGMATDIQRTYACPSN